MLYKPKAARRAMGTRKGCYQPKDGQTDAVDNFVAGLNKGTVVFEKAKHGGYLLLQKDAVRLRLEYYILREIATFSTANGVFL